LVSILVSHHLDDAYQRPALAKVPLTRKEKIITLSIICIETGR
jgi:hypothetical protein